MKKITVFVLGIAMMTSLAATAAFGSSDHTSGSAVSAQTEEAAGDEAIAGGWSKEDSTELTQETADVLNRAVEGMEGAVYEPVRLLASQVVAGTNYAILCKVTEVYPDAETSWCIAYVYEDLEGNAELDRVQDLPSDSEEDIEAALGETAVAIFAEADEAVEVSADESTEAIPRSTEGEVMVTASASVYSTPDMTRIIVSCENDGKDVQEVQSENSTNVAAVIEAVKNLGIDASSIKTSSFSLNPQYDYDNYGEIAGYEAETQITITDVPVENAAAVLTAVTEAGANNINSVSYFCSDYDEKYLEALTLAVKDAAVKAAVIAAADGQTLGAAVSVVEGYQDDSARYSKNSASSYSAGVMMEAENADYAEISVEPGETEIRAQVTVTYQMG